jgi:hypothetical protein
MSEKAVKRRRATALRGIAVQLLLAESGCTRPAAVSWPKRTEVSDEEIEGGRPRRRSVADLRPVDLKAQGTSLGNNVTLEVLETEMATAFEPARHWHNLPILV